MNELQDFLEKNSAWKLTETNSKHRRCLFSVSPGQEAFLATIISGSASHATTFEETLRQIEKVPLLIATLKDVSQSLQKLSFLEDAQMKSTRRKIESVLEALANSA